ncbi:MAG: transcription termination factor Rho [Eubacterium sp.]|nr:transcription termination factor Rho [Eubacterium sp.]
MDNNELSKLTLADIRKIAKEKGIQKVTTLRKPELIKELSKLAEPEKKVPKAEAKPAPAKETRVREQRTENRTQDNRNQDNKKNNEHEFHRGIQKARYHDGSDGLISVMKERQVVEIPPTELKHLDSGVTKNGILEIMPEGYGFIRCDNYLPGEDDVYVAPQFIRRFGLRTGDIIEGNLRMRTQNEKFSALLYMKRVNGRKPGYLYEREKFENLTPIFPDNRIHLETPNSTVSMRMLDLIAPIGKGQRGMIVSQPKTGKTTLLKQVAKAVTKNHPKMKLIILLIDERPEEVTDIKESIEGNQVEVIYSTFDELPENHKRVSEMVIERAKRLVESGEDVMILLDSITRLARAYNLTVTPSGRTLSGGLDPAALHMPKRFFGAARNMREGGSLTILATALVDTGSRMDDVVFEEFKGTGNMELVLDRSLSERRIFPAIDISKSSTRREDLLLDSDEQECVIKIRKALGGMKSDQAMEEVLQMFKRTKDNREFIETVRKLRL